MKLAARVFVIPAESKMAAQANAGTQLKNKNWTLAFAAVTR